MLEYDPVKEVQRVPVKDEQRIRTDFFCILCNSLFAILLFIISIAIFKKNELIKMSLPNDSTGTICGYDLANDYTILYYPDINDPTKRVCVSRCPHTNDKKVDCFQNDKTKCADLIPVAMDTEFQRTRIGLFCFPTDSDVKQKQILRMGISKRYHFLGIYDALFRSFWVSSLLAIIFVAFLQFFPLKVVPWTILIGGAFSLIFGLVVMILSSGSISLRILFFLISVGLAAACGWTLFKKQRMRQIFIYARIMQISTTVLRQNLMALVYIPIFGLFFAILIVLVGFETLAAWSISRFNFIESYPFYDLKGFGSAFLQFLIAIQFLWGMCFIKQASNFCVSGIATQWYYYKRNRPTEIKPFRSFINLFRFHWGSVLGCALLTAFFYVFDYIVDFLLNTDTNNTGQVKHYESLVEQKEYHEKRGCQDFLNLCRSQTMSYINLISIPYCNAARYCQQLSKSSHFFDYSQSTSRTYRLAGHMVILSLVTFISVMTVKSYSGTSDIWGIVYIAFVSIFTITFFIGLHGDLCQGLTISTFIEEGYNVEKTGERKIQIPEKIMRDTYDDDIKDKYHDATLSDLLFGSGK